jgi:hypothetical protein
MNPAARTGPVTRLRLLASVVVLAALSVGLLPASAQTDHPQVVSERPVSWTPHIQNGTVEAITVVGDTVVVGGTFTEVADATEQWLFPRRYLLTFGRYDGRIGRLEADLDGPVYALAPGPDGTVFVGGSFRTVDGIPQRGITRLRVATGQRVPEFRASIGWGTVMSLASHGDQVYLGGTFGAVNGADRPGLARLHGRTGALDLRFDAQLTAGGDRVSVRDLALAPAGDRLVAVGNFSHSHRLRRPQLVLLDTGGDRATLTRWYTDAYERPCAEFFRTYLRGVAFAPDGSYFVVVTTGGRTDPDELCNTAARFDATGTGMHRPRWVNHTGGNSLYAVAVTSAAVYVGGHQLWQDNPQGNKFAGRGAVEREGIAALHPAHGRALAWNPGRDRGVGVQDFHATAEGLLVGSDTTRLGGGYHARIGMFPLR